MNKKPSILTINGGSPSIKFVLYEAVSADDARVIARVISTDEELMIARLVCRMVGLPRSYLK